MMIETLPENFSLHKYGVDVRFVDEKDAAFILSLRNNARLGRYIHETDDDLDKQVCWIREYKKREHEGSEYYFIYSVNGEPYGVNRLYNIDKESKTCYSGSWVCKHGTEVEQAMATFLIQGEILFEMLHVEKNLFDVDKANKQVLKFEKIRGAKPISEDERSYNFCMDYEAHKKSCKRILSLINV